ncbi:MAG: stage II sporulation protein D [Candidatus Enterenecus sp.]
MQKPGIWAWVIRPLAAGALLGAAVLLLPLLAAGRTDAAELPQLLPASPSASAEPSSAAGRDGAYTVRVLREDGQVEALTMDEYLWRVVAAEMPASFEPEALKAQAVCARTYCLWKMSAGRHSGEGADVCDDSACCQAYTTREEAAERWGDAAETYAAKIAAAVADTDGQVLTYEGEPIQAAFFSSSTAATEDAAEVWGSSLPYLVSVDSPEGDEVPNYRSTVTLTAEELKELVMAAYPGADLSGDPSGWITDTSYTASGRVAEMDVGGITLSGGGARALFSLRSACFTVEEAEGVFTFSVIGYGHGVGMSQYGANAMAKEGSTWQEIVTHYYTGVEIQTGL